MFRLLLALALFFPLLHAEDVLTIEEANYLLKKQDTNAVYKAYHAFKNIRINAIMEGNIEAQKASLKGIVSAGKLLRIDVEKYVSEIDELGSQKSSDEDSGESAPLINILQQAHWKYGDIVLTFKHKLMENQIHYFTLDKKFNNKYRYVFDIKTESSKSFELSKLHLTDLRLGQSSPNVMRLVIENDTAIPISFLRKGRELIIHVGKKGRRISEEVIAQQNELEMNTTLPGTKTIVIDPGHGGKDSGAVGFRKYQEKDIVYKVSKLLKIELEKVGYKVYMTRDTDRFIELRNRTAYANKKNADLFISIHANSVPRTSGFSKHHGLETYFLAPSTSTRAKNVAATENSKEVADMNYFGKESFLNFLNKQKILASNKLAIDLQKGMLSVLRRAYSKVRDGGVRKGPFWVLVGAQMPAVLVEVGFVTNPKEVRNLLSSRYQQSIAYGLALGVQNYFRVN